jgi:hypothetical protein
METSILTDKKEYCIVYNKRVYGFIEKNEINIFIPSTFSCYGKSIEEFNKYYLNVDGNITYSGKIIYKDYFEKYKIDETYWMISWACNNNFEKAKYECIKACSILKLREDLPELQKFSPISYDSGKNNFPYIHGSY